MNVFTGIGRVGRDAELKYTQGGDAILKFSVAVDAGYGDKKATTWLDCAMFGKRGEKLAEHICKGDRIGITGELSTREHEGKTYVQIRLNDLTLLGGKRSSEEPQRGGGRSRPAPSTGPTGGDDAVPDDDIPFVTNRGLY